MRACVVANMVKAAGRFSSSRIAVVCAIFHHLSRTCTACTYQVPVHVKLAMYRCAGWFALTNSEGRERAVLWCTHVEDRAQLRFLFGRLVSGFRDDDHKKLLSQVDVWLGGALIKKAPRVFCGIYTHQPNHATKVKVSTSPMESSLPTARPATVQSRRLSKAEYLRRYVLTCLGLPCVKLVETLRTSGLGAKGCT